MGWENVDDKLKKGIDARFVSCEESYEKSYIKKITKEEFPYLRDSLIDSAIDECCKNIRAPRPRKDFIDCLKRKLG